MAKPVFKEYNQGQVVLFPPSLDEKLPADSPARLVSQIVDNLDISSVVDTYKGGGSSAYHPRMMLKVVIFGYLNNIYSCRKIENALNDRLSFMWLSGNQTPDHNTINRFRSSRLKDAIHDIFTQVVKLLVDMGCLSLDVVYMDGTKIESRANRYTFVWRKSVEKYKANLEEKIRKILEQVEEGIADDNSPDDEPPTPINSEELKKRIAAINRENRTKAEQKAIKTLDNKHLPKLQEYENHLKVLGNRNSYSKTDHAATFMRMKDDHMKNGQLKPAHNVQIATENQFFTHYDFYPNPGDTLTLKPFLNGFKERYDKYPKKNVADAGYGSEENYEFMEENEIEAYVKYNYFHKENTKKFKSNGFLVQNLYYNKEQDYYVCPMGQHMEKVGNTTRKSDSGFVSHLSVYMAKNCNGCPLRGLCHTAKAERRIEVNHNLNRHREKARQLLTSEEGLLYRSRRPIEPEAVFGQSKSNKGYNRFRHFDEDSPEKVMMDFAIFAVAFNLLKLHRIMENTKKNCSKSELKDAFLPYYIIFVVKFIEFEKVEESGREKLAYAA
jgi:transposase